MNRIRGFPRSTSRTLEDWVFIDDKWHHLVVIVGLDPRVYIDGKEPVHQDSVAVYDRVLSREEITKHYSNAVRQLHPTYYSSDDPTFVGDVALLRRLLTDDLVTTDERRSQLLAALDRLADHDV